MTEFCLEVRGDYACFTRPEFKVERVSYEVMTPSAARSIFEAILWKPAISWQIRRIEVLEPIRWMSLRRNEVGAKASVRLAEAAMRGGSDWPVLYIEDERQQRAGLFLRDVAYRIHATLTLSGRASQGDSLTKYGEMFKRRASRGQCVNQPYLGTREFACRFRLVESLDGEPAPVSDSRDLGLMLYDLDFTNAARPTPLFYRAQMAAGVVQVPDRQSVAVLR